jgi:hypothetical protein
LLSPSTVTAFETFNDLTERIDAVEAFNALASVATVGAFKPWHRPPGQV